MNVQRNAQQIVLQKTKFFQSDSNRKFFLERLKKAKSRTIEEAIQDGTVLCGKPETVVKQIKRTRTELGVGWIGTNMKIGNIPNDVVNKGMELFRDYVAPEVNDMAKPPEPAMALVGE